MRADDGRRGGHDDLNANVPNLWAASNNVVVDLEVLPGVIDPSVPQNRSEHNLVALLYGLDADRADNRNSC